MSADSFRELAEMFKRSKNYFKEAVDYILGKIRSAESKNSFFDMLISGGQGMGKSTLALYILYKYYGSREEVLRNVFFRVDDLNETLLNEKRKAVLLDDAGITLSKYRAMDEVSVDYYALQQIGRTMVSAIIYTTVYDNLAKFIRDIVDVVVALHTRTGDVVYGTLYRKKQKYYTIVKKKYDFEMNLGELHADREFHELYEEYYERRKKFAKDVVKELLERKKARKEKEEAEEFELKMEKARREARNDFISKIDELMNSFKS